MASTNKTPQLGLNQWAAGDSVLRTDFNADNAKLDTMVGRGSCVTGKFIGDGTTNRAVNLGFRPRFVWIAGLQGNGYWYSGVILGHASFVVGGNGTSETPQDSMYFTDTGFTLASERYFNKADNTVNYAAFY